MRIFSWNVNGIRAAARKGFLAWLAEARPDVLGLQEIKATPAQLGADLLQEHGYHVLWNPAEKPGYSGTALFAREPFEVVATGLGRPEFDREGRLTVTRHGDLLVVNSYCPHGGRTLERVPFKLAFHEALLGYLEGLRAAGERVVLGGDLNIAHHPIDLKNWKANQKTSGFRPEERAWLDALEGKGWIDAFRRLHPDEADHYSWWSNRSGARARNVGWRIDHHWLPAALWPRVKAARIHPAVQGSDHCPVEIEID